MQYCKSSGKSVPGLTNEKDKRRRLCGETLVSDQGVEDRTNMTMDRSRQHFLPACVLYGVMVLTSYPKCRVQSCIYHT